MPKTDELSLERFEGCEYYAVVSKCVVKCFSIVVFLSKKLALAVESRGSILSFASAYSI